MAGPPGLVTRKPPAPKAWDLLTMFPVEIINWKQASATIIIQDIPEDNLKTPVRKKANCSKTYGV